METRLEAPSLEVIVSLLKVLECNSVDPEHRMMRLLKKRSVTSNTMEAKFVPSKAKLVAQVMYPSEATESNHSTLESGW